MSPVKCKRRPKEGCVSLSDSYRYFVTTRPSVSFCLYQFSLNGLPLFHASRRYPIEVSGRDTTRFIDLLEVGCYGVNSRVVTVTLHVKKTRSLSESRKCKVKWMGPSIGNLCSSMLLDSPFFSIFSHGESSLKTSVTFVSILSSHNYNFVSVELRWYPKTELSECKFSVFPTINPVTDGSLEFSSQFESSRHKYLVTTL